MRILIIGGGVIALLTAVEAVRAGHHVVVCDQHTIPNPLGTSYAHHRVLRALHLGDPAATEAAHHAHRAWLALADRFATDFYHPVGAVSVLPRVAASAAFSLLPSAHPITLPQVTLPPDSVALFEPDAGVLLADRVLACAAHWLSGRPQVELREHHRAVAVNTDRATVRFADGQTLGADAILLAQGPWARALLPDAITHDLVLYRQSVLYCDSPGPAWPGMPSVRGLGTDGSAWLVPPVAGTPVKLSAATACRVVTDISDRLTPKHWRDHLIAIWSSIIPGLRATGLVGQDCYYLAHPPTDGAAIAYLSPTVLSFAACGGGSFKFAPLVARALTARLCGATPTDTFPHTDLFPHTDRRGDL